jgi:hypothetical protein
MDNPETQATLGTQDTGRINVRENRRGKSRMDNPETLATLGTQDTGRINVRENRRGKSRMDNPDIGNIGNTRHRTKTNKTKTKRNTTPHNIGK